VQAGPGWVERARANPARQLVILKVPSIEIMIQKKDMKCLTNGIDHLIIYDFSKLENCHVVHQAFAVLFDGCISMIFYFYS
jgi:hypothetical protein